MAAGAAGVQQILTSTGYLTLKQIYDTYVFSGAIPKIAYVEPTAFRDVKYMSVKTIFSYGLRTGIRLKSEDDVTAIVCTDGFILDLAEDYPPRPTVKHPSDAKCLVGPNMDSTGKYFVRKIVSREFVIINCYTLPVPNMIARGGYVIIT